MIQIIALSIPDVKITNEEWATFVTTQFDLKVCKCAIYSYASESSACKFEALISRCIIGEDIIKSNTNMYLKEILLKYNKCQKVFNPNSLKLLSSQKVYTTNLV